MRGVCEGCEGETGRSQPTLKFTQGKLATREGAGSNAEDHVEVAGGSDVGNGKGKMMMFLIFVFFVEVRDVKCMMNMKELDSGSYWYDKSPVFAGVRPMRTRT